MILLTNKELEKVTGEKEMWMRLEWATYKALNKAQLKKVHQKIGAMVASGYSLDEILLSMFKELE